VGIGGRTRQHRQGGQALDDQNGQVKHAQAKSRSRAFTHSSDRQSGLGAPPDSIPEIEGMAWLRERADGPARREDLASIYFDTPKSKLRKHGVALRIRQVGEKRLQTIKSVGKGELGAPGETSGKKRSLAGSPI
jgi:hypothetical protein